MTYRRDECCGGCRVVTVQIPGPHGGQGEKGDTPDDVVLYKPQELTDEEKLQAQKNLGLETWSNAPSFADMYQQAKEGDSNG